MTGRLSSIGTLTSTSRNRFLLPFGLKKMTKSIVPRWWCSLIGTAQDVGDNGAAGSIIKCIWTNRNGRMKIFEDSEKGTLASTGLLIAYNGVSWFQQEINCLNKGTMNFDNELMCKKQKFKLYKSLYFRKE